MTETPQIDGPLLIPTLVIVTILFSSAVLWIRQVQKPVELIQPEVGIHSWAIGWANFLIFICAMVIAVFITQNIAGSFLIDPDNPPTELTPWIAIAAVLLHQLPMLGVFYGARRFYPGYYADRLNQAQLPAWRAFKTAFSLFIMYVPLIWVATLVWSGVLFQLKEKGLIDEVEPQQLVTLFQEGGDVSALIILVLMAVIVAPIVEEIIFRGCIYRFFKSKMTLLAAQIASGGIFALMHENLLSFVPLVVVGIVLAKIYEKTGNLSVAIWFHAFFNSFSLIMLFITSFSENLPT